MRCPNCGFEISTNNCTNCGSKNEIPTGQANFNHSAAIRLQDDETKRYRTFTSKAEKDKAIHTLEGILKGITIDNQINISEAIEVVDWYNHYEKYVNTHPFSELIPLIGKAIQDGILYQDELADILWLSQNISTESRYYDVITSDIQKLEGILHGILSDNQITSDEIHGLSAWLQDNEHLAGTYPYDEIYSLCVVVLADGIVSDDEKKILKAFFSDFIDTSRSRNIDTIEIAAIKKEMSIHGVCATCPDITIENRVFCFTGASSKTSRKGFANVIGSLKGIYKDNVVQSTDYLIIGNEGNPCWAFSCYGRKVEAAVKLRKNGHKIMLIHEHDFWDFLEDLIS